MGAAATSVRKFDKKALREPFKGWKPKAGVYPSQRKEISLCFVDMSSLSHVAAGVSRRQFLGGGLAAGVAGTALGLGKSLLLPGVAEGAEPAPKSEGPGSAGVNFKWFGTDGWEITFGNKTILLDPWFSRFDTGFFAGKFNAKTPIKVEEALIDQHIPKADQILIGHGHWDHMADIPYIAKKTGAQVIGSETHANVLRALQGAESRCRPRASAA